MAARPQPMRSLTLADGRRLGVDTYGDPDGAPVVWCHGGLSCRLDVAHANAAARAAGLRLIAPDRPGTGGSDPADVLTAASFADDIAELCTQLGVDRFGLLGWSGGTVYATVAAARLADRVTALGLIAPVAPPQAGLWQRVAWADRALGTLAHRDPAAAARILTAMRHLPLEPTLPPVERATLVADATPGPTVTTIYRAATTHGVHGTLADYAVYQGDWGIDLTDVTAPTAVFVGANDTFAPPVHARWLAEALPAASLTVSGGLGHFLFHARRDLILAAVTPR